MIKEDRTADPVSEKKVQKEREFYKVAAERFDRTRQNANHFYKIEEIEDLIFSNVISKNISRKYRFLEVGAGTGIHAFHFAARFRENIEKFCLCDLSREMLEVARDRMAGFREVVEFLVSPAEELDIDGGFDGVYVSGALHHFADPFQALMRIKRALKPGGVLVICEPIVWNPVNFIKALKSREWGQFTSARRNKVRGYLKKIGFNVISEKVLHYRSGNVLLRKIWPYKALGKIGIFDPLAIMFLYGAVSQERGEKIDK